MALVRILDVILSLFFVFFLFSLLASWVPTLISRFLNIKGKFLHRFLFRMLNEGQDCPEIEAFFKHPRIESLKDSRGHDPETIPPLEFSLALMDVIKAQAKKEAEEELPLTVETFEKGIAAVKTPALRKSLDLALAFVKKEGRLTDEKLQRIAAELVSWFDTSMNNLKALYKKYVLKITLLAGISIAGCANLDTFQLVNELWNDSNLRQPMIEIAVQTITTETPRTAESQLPEIDKLMLEIEKLNLPIRWSPELNRKYLYQSDSTLTKPRVDIKKLLIKILGIFISGLAISQGSTFWYEILKNLVGIRTTAKKLVSSEGEN